MSKVNMLRVSQSFRVKVIRMPVGIGCPLKEGITEAEIQEWFDAMAMDFYFETVDEAIEFVRTQLRNGTYDEELFNPKLKLDHFVIYDLEENVVLYGRLNPDEGNNIILEDAEGVFPTVKIFDPYMDLGRVRKYEIDVEDPGKKDPEELAQMIDSIKNLKKYASEYRADHNYGSAIEADYRSMLLFIKYQACKSVDKYGHLIEVFNQ